MVSICGIEIMRISEILFWNNQPSERNRSDHLLDLPHARFHDDLMKVASAYAKDCLVKHFRDLKGSESQPSGPAPPDPGTELIPRGILEPPIVWQADPIETASGEAASARSVSANTESIR
jgi:hypothetical protein